MELTHDDLEAKETISRTPVNYFAGAGVSEITARITYRLIEMDYKRNQGRYLHPTNGMRALAVDLRSYEDTFIHTCFASAGAFLAGNKGTLKQWRDGVVYRSRYYMAARRAGRPWDKAPTPVLLTGGSVDDHLRAITGTEVIEPYKPTKKGGKRVKR